MSNKHKHYEMIVAKAANMSLVKFIKMDGEWENAGLSDKFISFSEEYEYFLCLPQHEEAVLEKLNGGECQFLPPVDDGVDWVDFENQQFEKWSSDWWYMDSAFESRIKPKEEVRWIAYDPRQKRAMMLTFDNLEAIKDHYKDEPNRDFQFIEIEVEV